MGRCSPSPPTMPASRWKRRARSSGAIRLKDATCPAIHAALRASEMGNPFAPLRGIIGSDLLKHRADSKAIENPFGVDDPIVLPPAIPPHAALFHAPLAPRHAHVCA